MSSYSMPVLSSTLSWVYRKSVGGDVTARSEVCNCASILQDEAVSVDHRFMLQASP
jgi:hypothetical protein